MRLFALLRPLPPFTLLGFLSLTNRLLAPGATLFNGSPIALFAQDAHKAGSLGDYDKDAKAGWAVLTVWNYSIGDTKSVNSSLTCVRASNITAGSHNPSLAVKMLPGGPWGGWALVASVLTGLLFTM